jgi:hypothetical protein
MGHRPKEGMRALEVYDPVMMRSLAAGSSP